MEEIEADAQRKVAEEQRRREEAEQAVRDAERARVERRALELQEGDTPSGRDSGRVKALTRERSLDLSDMKLLKGGPVCSSSSSSGDDQAHDERLCDVPSLPLEDSTPFTSDTERLSSSAFQTAAVGASVDRGEAGNKGNESVFRAAPRVGSAGDNTKSKFLLANPNL